MKDHPQRISIDECRHDWLYFCDWTSEPCLVGSRQSSDNQSEHECDINRLVANAGSVATEFGCTDRIFVRPDNPLKPFSGRVLDVDWGSRKSLDHGFYYEDETLPVIVAPIVDVACQFLDSDPTVFKWSLSRILDWSIAPNVSCPVYHLHGDRDWTLPLRYTDPDKIVAGGGHLLLLTHPAEVNSYIRQIQSQVASTLTTAPETNEPEL